MQYSNTPYLATAPVTPQPWRDYSDEYLPSADLHLPGADYLPSADYFTDGYYSDDYQPVLPLELSHSIFVEPLDNWCASPSKTCGTRIQQPPRLEVCSSIGIHLRDCSNEIVPPPGLSPSSSCELVMQSMPTSTVDCLAEIGIHVEQSPGLEVGKSLRVPCFDFHGCSTWIVPPPGLSPLSTCDSVTPSSAESTAASLADIAGDQSQCRSQRSTGSETPINMGSRGHPELCARPCLYFAIGQCANGTDCSYCHAHHENRSMHLDKRQRLAVKDATFLEIAQIIIPILKDKLESMGVNTKILSPMEDLLTQEHPIGTIPAEGRLSSSLSRMTARSLLAVLSRKADHQQDKLNGIRKHLQSVFGLTSFLDVEEKNNI